MWPRPLRGLTPTLGTQIPEGPQSLPGTLKLENPFGTPKPPRNSKTLLGSQKPLWDAKRLLAPPPPPKPRPPADSTTPTARRSSAPCRSASATPAALATPTGDTSREAWPSVTWGRGHMRAVSVARGGAMGKGWDQIPLGLGASPGVAAPDPAGSDPPGPRHPAAPHAAVHGPTLAPHLGIWGSKGSVESGGSKGQCGQEVPRCQ